MEEGRDYTPEEFEAMFASQEVLTVMKKLNKEKKKKKRVEVNHQEKCPMYGNITRKCPSQINQGIFVVYARFAVT
ncbi:hypothetical protein KSS87_006560 [Heliosperma pusillum]|nr:hypothetical protein KSS87_006560 [Heliosperma pusillum]